MTEKASVEYIQNSKVFSANSLVEDTFKMAEASVKFTRAVLDWVWDTSWDPMEEHDAIFQRAEAAGLVGKFDTPNHPEGYDWEYRLTELGKQVLA